MKTFSKTLILGGTILLLLSGPVYAMLIDFRTDEPFNTDQPNGSTFYSATIGDLTLEFTPLGTSANPTLYWDDTDGFGVIGGGYEDDEVETPEKLKIKFIDPIYVYSFHLTDLFYEGGYYEEGRWSLDDITWTSFSQTDSNQLPSPASNGEYTLPINSIVSNIWFTAPGETGTFCTYENHEFSVAAVNVVPEPTTILLLGSGLIGLAGFRRKFRKR